MIGRANATTTTVAVLRQVKIFNITQRAFWVWLHRWFGLLAALPLLIVMLSGTLLALAPEIDRQLEPQLYHSPSEARLPLMGVVNLLKSQEPELHIAHVSVPHSAGKPFTVYGRKAGKHVKLYINGSSGAIYQASDSQFIRWLETLHRNLTLKQPGRYLVGVSTIVLALLTLSGLYLWWPMRRHTINRLRSRGDALSWHNSIGLISLPFLLMVALTGITLTFHKPVMDFVHWATLSAPIPAAPTVSAKTDNQISLATALNVASDAYPSAKIMAFGEPAEAGKPFSIRLRMPGDWHPVGWQQIFIHPYQPKVLGTLNHYEYSPAAAYANSWWVWHTGEIFGTTGRWLWSLLSFAGTTLLLTGLWFWYRRRWLNKK